MGHGMAANFLKHGYGVVVWNRDRKKLKFLIQKGAVDADTPREAAAKADIVFEVTADDESSRTVWFGPDGILSGARKDSMLISSATLSVSWVEKLAHECATQKLAFFDMPLTGGRGGAETGKLVLLVGGDKRKLETLKPVLSAISEKILYFGKAGSGAKFKLLLNMLQAIHVVAFGEVIKIAKDSGLNLKAVGDALAERPGGIPTAAAWRSYDKVPKPINFSVRWIAKDLSYAKAFSGGLPAPLLDEVLKKYRKAIDEGMGEDDWTIINR